MLWGGAGGDVFLFNVADCARNTIHDLEGADRIVFDAELFAPSQLRREIAELDGDGRNDTRLSLVDAAGTVLTVVEVLGAAEVGTVLFQ